MIVSYRLFRKSSDGKPEVLFHRINGTKIIPLDVWVDAEIKHVFNPGSRKNSLGFVSGFHIALSYEDVKKYMSKFKNRDNLVICKVFVDQIRPKPRSFSRIYLSNRMVIFSDDWFSAIGEEFYGKAI